MTHAYVLEHDDEAERLERQALRPAYAIGSDLSSIDLAPGQSVLDMGCGSGLSCRELAGRFPDTQIEGCDASEQRLAQARSLLGERNNVRLFASRLESIQAETNHYDWGVARFVLEHVEDPIVCLREALRVLKPGGKLLVIEFDGQLLNLFPVRGSLGEKLNKLGKELPVNFFIGREIPSMMLEAGFTDVRWNVEVCDFQGEELEAERELSADRIRFAWPAIVQILGSEESAEELRRDYLGQFREPGTVLFYNKFWVTGTKPA